MRKPRHFHYAVREMERHIIALACLLACLRFYDTAPDKNGRGARDTTVWQCYDYLAVAVVVVMASFLQVRAV